MRGGAKQPRNLCAGRFDDNDVENSGPVTAVLFG